MGVTPIRENKILEFSQWSIDDPDYHLAEMFNDNERHLVCLGVRLIEFGWLWETADAGDKVLEFGIEQDGPAARSSAEASAIRILLAA